MLKKLEEEIREAIRKSDVPFLGLLGDTISSANRTALDIAILSNPTISGYIRNLGLYPALFSVNLTYFVMQGMGQAGHFELYPHIQKAIGSSKVFSANDRESLWKAFRRAIVTLGFEPSPRTSGPHYMANEYLRQVGVPIAFAADLASRMLTFAKRVGIPDEYDPESLIGWQAALDAKLEQPFSSTARKAVALDIQGYYTRKFVKIHASTGEVIGKSNALDNAMARAFHGLQSESSFRRAVLPYLILSDDQLAIFIPGGDEREYEITVDGKIQYLRTGIEDKLFSINELLPSVITIRDLKGNQSTKYEVWEDHRPNKLLFFSDTGRYRGRGQLNQSDSLILPPGKYIILSRFSPLEIDTEQLWDDPMLYIFTRQIHPGENVKFTNGPASIEIIGESQPIAAWSGTSRKTKEGVEFFYGETNLNIEFPIEWMDIAGNKLSLKLTAIGLDEQLEMPFSLDGTGKFSLNITLETANLAWKSGFTRLVAEVNRLGESRSLVRSSAFYWLGLNKITTGLIFDCTSIPSNILPDLNENIKINGNCLSPKDGFIRTLRLVFKLDDIRSQSLTWNAPGVYIEVESTSESGALTRSSRSVGSVEPVSVMSAKQIIITASDDGELSLGDWVQKIEFSHVQSKRLPAAFIANRISPQASCLVYKNEATGNQYELLRFVQPHHVTSISSKVSAGQLKIKICLPKDLDALTIHVQDVVSGVNFDLTLESNLPEQTLHRFGRAQLICMHEDVGGFSAHIYFSLDFWPTGAWVFQFDGKVDGIWGHLENTRQDQFALGFLCQEQGFALSTQSFIESLPMLTDKQSLEMLERVQAAILPCYSQQSWTSMTWLLDAWNYLLDKWLGREPEVIDVLMTLAALKPPLDSSASWMLQQTVGSRNIKIFCLPSNEYRKVPTIHKPIVQAINMIYSLNKEYPFIFPHLVNPVAAMGFVNCAEVFMGKQPKGYSISNYLATLRATGNVVSDLYRLEDSNFSLLAGDYLGALHYKYATRRLEEGYELCRAGNDVRLGQLIMLCNYACRIMPTFTQNDSKRLAGLQPHLEPWLLSGDEDIDDYLAQRKHNIHAIAHAISLVAYYCRLDACSEGAIDKFLMKLKLSNAPVEKSLACMLQLGDVLFAYYLVLWDLVIKADRSVD